MTDRRCVAPFCGGPAMYRGIACEVHWELLSDEARAVLNEWLNRRHPRGGGISTVPEGLFATAGAGDGIVRREWADLMRQDLADGQYDDSPDFAAFLRERYNVSALPPSTSAATLPPSHPESKG